MERALLVRACVFSAGRLALGQPGSHRKPHLRARRREHVHRKRRGLRGGSRPIYVGRSPWRHRHVGRDGADRETRNHLRDLWAGARSSSALLRRSRTQRGVSAGSRIVPARLRAYWAYWAQAIVASNSGATPEVADEHIQRSIELATVRGQRPFLAQAHFYHSRILARRGEATAASTALNRATDLFEQMDMTGWLTEARRLTL